MAGKFGYDKHHDKTKNTDKSSIIAGFTSPQYQRAAYESYERFYNPVTKEDSFKTYINGTLTCFCKDVFERSGISSAFKQYRKDGLDQIPEDMLKML